MKPEFTRRPGDKIIACIEFCKMGCVIQDISPIGEIWDRQTVLDYLVKDKRENGNWSVSHDPKDTQAHHFKIHWVSQIVDGEKVLVKELKELKERISVC